MSAASQRPVPFSVHTEHRDGVVRLRFMGELDLASETVVDHALREAVRRARTEVLVDLSELDFMDSTGLSVLLRAHLRSATEETPPIHTIGARGPVMKLLEISGVQRTLDGNGQTPSTEGDRGWDPLSSSRP